MGLADFVRSNIAAIVQQWEDFASTIEPPASHLSSAELRDWSEQLLLAIADEMDEPQTTAEQALKSKGLEPEHAAKLTRHSHIHAAERLVDGYTIEQMVAEFRALRATVIRLWDEQTHEQSERKLADAVRFNEAIDQALTESVHEFSGRLERARDLFLSSLTHDLRDPLSAIRLSVEILLHSEEELEEEAVRSVIRIRDSTDRMQAILDEMLGFAGARLTARLPICREPLDLGELCRTLVDEQQRIHPDTEWVLELDGDLSGLWDRAHIEQALAHLLASVEAGRHGPVRLRAAGLGDEVGLVVQSQSGPLVLEQRPLALDPVRRDRPEGAGLGSGLYVAQRVIEHHGGRLIVRGDAGGATRSELRLPRRAPAELR